MAEAARERGYEYVAITDHSATHGFGNDVPPDELLRQIERIRGAARLDGITRARRAPRCNMLLDGSLDYEDDAARAARLGGGEPAHLVPHGGEGDDRAHDRARWSTRSWTRSAIRPAA